MRHTFARSVLLSMTVMNVAAFCSATPPATPGVVLITNIVDKMYLSSGFEGVYVQGEPINGSLAFYKGTNQYTYSWNAAGVRWEGGGGGQSFYVTEPDQSGQQTATGYGLQVQPSWTYGAVPPTYADILAKGVWYDRQPVLFNRGGSFHQTAVGEPINAINGDVAVDETDVVIPAHGWDLSFRRSYDTILPANSTLGPRWRHNYDWRIFETNTVFLGNTNVWVVIRTGTDWEWREAHGSNVSGRAYPQQLPAWDYTLSNGAYTVAFPYGVAYRFGTNGLAERWEDGAGHSLVFSYTNISGSALLTAVTHSDGRALRFEYGASNLLSRVLTPATNLTVLYTYDNSGKLTNVLQRTPAGDKATSYSWDDSTSVMTQRVDAAGVPTIWEYAGTKGTRSYIGTNLWFDTTLQYLTGRTVVTVKRGDTNLVSCYDYDGDMLQPSALNAVSTAGWPAVETGTPGSLVISNSSIYYNTLVGTYTEEMDAGGWPIFRRYSGGSVASTFYWDGQKWRCVNSNGQQWFYVTAAYQSPWVVPTGASVSVVPWYDYGPLYSIGSEYTLPVPARWFGSTFSQDEYGNPGGTILADERLNDGSPFKIAASYGPLHLVTNWACGYMTDPTNAWSFEWDTNTQCLVAIIDPQGHRAEWDYTNGLVSVVRAFPATNQPVETRYAYTTNGRLAAVTNANGHWVRCQYDGYGYPTSVIPQAGPTNDMVWDSLGHLRELRLAGNGLATNREPGSTVPRRVTFDPDELGRVRRVTWPDNTCDTFAYDAVGNLTNHTDAAGRQTGYAWLPTRKLAAVTRDRGGLAATTRLEYDRQFNTTRVIDELERPVETYRLDLQNRPTIVSNVDGQVMTINWGLADFVQSIVRFDGTTNAVAYDTGGRVSQVTYPGATLAFSYFKNGLLMAASNQWGAISNTFDGANRLTSVSTPVPNGIVAYALYPVGQVSNTVSVVGTNSYVLDAAERLMMLTVANPGVAAASFQYGYSALNGLVSTTGYPNGIGCSVTYDKMDRPIGMVWKNASNQVIRSRAYAYNGVGMITSAVYETGEQVAYTYDSLDRLTGERHLNASGQVVSDETYGYDLAGNRTNKTVWAGATPLITVRYSPGTGNRLDAWSVAETDLVGQVDVAGMSSEPIGTSDRFGWLYVSNLNGTASSKPYVAGTNFWAYDLTVGLGTQKIVAAIRDAAGNTTRVTNEVCLTVVTNGTYQHDLAGCVTNMAYRGKDFASTLGLTWDGQYQLTAVATNGTVAERYGYDALGRRIWTWDAASGTNWHVYDGPHVIADLNSTGGILRTFTYGPGIDNILSMTAYAATTRTVYYIKDHFGSVLALTDKDGNVVENYRYDAWGRTTVYDASGNTLSQSAYGNRYCWQGREYSWRSGLYYFRARWYTPVEGRWLSNDPIGISGGLNQYVFCGNNPVNFRDPFGLCEDGDAHVRTYLHDLHADWGGREVLNPFTLDSLYGWSLSSGNDGEKRDIKWDGHQWSYHGGRYASDAFGNLTPAYALATEFGEFRATVLLTLANMKGFLGSLEDGGIAKAIEDNQARKYFQRIGLDDARSGWNPSVVDRR